MIYMFLYNLPYYHPVILQYSCGNHVNSVDLDHALEKPYVLNLHIVFKTEQIWV